MAAPDSVDPAGWLDDHLAGSSPDLLRNMVKTFAEAMMSAEADQLCGADYGTRSPERTNSRNGYPVPGLGHPRRDRGAGDPETAVGQLLP
jgi:putative transposase